MNREACLKNFTWMAVAGVLLVLAAPAFAEAGAEQTRGAVESGASMTPCSQDLLVEETSLPRFLPDFLTEEPGRFAGPPKLRTCACSCGLPCSTNADCGFGGLCISGITCCVAPLPNETRSPLTLEEEEPAAADNTVAT